MGSVLTSLPALKASQRWEGCTEVGGRCRGWAVNGAAAMIPDLVWPCLLKAVKLENWGMSGVNP